MDTETMIRELKSVEEKHKHDKVFTGHLSIAEMAYDTRKRLEELKPYEDTGLTPEQIKKLKEENDWIPVEERLPEGQTRVICQFDNGDIELLWQDWESDPETLTYLADFSMMAEKKVIAWRPLPDPYLPKKDN